MGFKPARAGNGVVVEDQHDFCIGRLCGGVDGGDDARRRSIERHDPAVGFDERKQTRVERVALDDHADRHRGMKPANALQRVTEAGRTIVAGNDDFASPLFDQLGCRVHQLTPSMTVLCWWKVGNGASRRRDVRQDGIARANAHSSQKSATTK